MPAKKNAPSAPAAEEAATAKAPTKPALKLRIRVTAGELIAIGPGKIDLLEALAETRSITSAAKSLGMSYRRAWMLIDQLNQSLREPAVASAVGGQHGGGSELTDTGRELIALYRGIEAQALKAAQADIRKLLKLLTA